MDVSMIAECRVLVNKLFDVGPPLHNESTKAFRLSQKVVFSRILVLLVHLGLCITHVGIQENSHIDIVNRFSRFANKTFPDDTTNARSFALCQEFAVMLQQYAVSIIDPQEQEGRELTQAQKEARKQFFLAFAGIKERAHQVWQLRGGFHGVAFLQSKHRNWRNELEMLQTHLGEYAFRISRGNINWMVGELRLDNAATDDATDD
jgi:hypothetical protein